MNSQYTIPAIPDCQGYIWMSDQSMPEVIDCPFEGLSLTVKNPFITEAYLFDRTKKVSYSIRFIDGQYVVSAIETRLFKNATHHKFFASWDEKVILLFENEWTPIEDPLCENMEVFTAAEFAFVGFEKI